MAGSVKKTGIIAVITIFFFTACSNPEHPVDNNLAVVSVVADGSSTRPNLEPTAKLTITLNESIRGLTADDFILNAHFNIIKGKLIQLNDFTYELEIIPGESGIVRVGLDPYNLAGWEWRAVNVRVHAIFHFSFNPEAGNRELTITGYGGLGGEGETIPSEIGGFQVTSIGNRAFINSGLAGKINIPNTITSIGSTAFAYNQLREVIIPGSVTFIGDNAFFRNNLEQITISSGITHIGSLAFANNKLDQIEIPGTVTFIGNGAFEYNELTRVTFQPESKIVTFNNRVFLNNNLSEIVIPENIKTIREAAFWGNNLTKITIGESVDLFGYPFANGFEFFYETNGRKAGTYILNQTPWIIQDP